MIFIENQLLNDTKIIKDDINNITIRDIINISFGDIQLPTNLINMSVSYKNNNNMTQYLYNYNIDFFNHLTLNDVKLNIDSNGQEYKKITIRGRLL